MADILIRIPENVADALTEWASATEQSRNALLVSLLEKAVARRRVDDEQAVLDSQPWLTGYVRVLLATATICAETGAEIPARTYAWQEVWSDRSEGEIVSEAWVRHEWGD